VGTEGQLGGQARVEGVSGTWKDLTDNVNSMANNLTTQVRGIADVTTAVANGDLSKKITVDAQGEIAELADTINTMVDQLSSFAAEVTRVAREVGTEGKLGGQARVEGVSGTWEDLTDNVNAMADNLTTQVRGIATVVTAVAKGNLNRKLSVDAKGEIAELANTINDMIETLDTFADQVTTVAREVGVEGKLGGQAEVPGASGTWRDLTDNVNQLAANLTTQVRAITEVTTAVAAGDLSKKITVDAAGEVADLKDNVNEMIRNLKETTRKNNEQDWLKTNLAKFTQLLQGQKDLKTVSKLVLSELAPLVNVQHGAFYIADENEEELPAGKDPSMKLLATYAYKKRKSLSNRFEPGEGLVGQCAMERERILLTDVPNDYIAINSGLGEAEPLNIVVLPVLFEGNVKAVIELASFQQFDDIHLNFLDQLTESIGIVLNTLEANMRTERLLAQSQSQQEQLTETNEQLEEKAQSLEESEEKLKQQQKELQQTNRELEDKAELLAEQKSEVERKNQEIEQARKALEEKAEQLALTSKYKSEFLANMSHELRTPLNSMLILSKMLAENREGNLTDKQIDYAETVHSSGADLLGLINEILDLSKIESGSMGVEIADVPVADVLDDLDGLFNEVANEKGIDFRIEMHDGVPERMETDQKRLQQVLKNLISNSLKFTEEGYVKLEALPAPQDMSFDKKVLQNSERVVGFKVKDTGPGVPEEKQKVIFEAFQQAEGGTDRDHGGTGLGLSISREIARLLGGELRLEETGPEGSTFAFYLPKEYEQTELAQDNDEQAPGGDGAAPPEGSTEMPSFNTEDLFSGDEPTATGGEEESDDADGSEEPEPAPAGNDLGDRAREAEADEADEALRPAEVAQSLDAPQSSETEAPEVESPDTTEVAPGGNGAPPEGTPAPAKEAQSLKDDRADIEPDDSVLLIVEDDPKFAGILLDTAHEKGFKGVVAPHGELAPQLARRYTPDAITLDVRLPGMHGITLLDQLKNDPKTRTIPITIISVVEDLSRREKKGALTYLQKPITEEDVSDSLSQLKEFAGREVKNLLVVEDEDTHRESLAEHVRGEKVQITAVATGGEALDAFEAGQYDCAVIDLTLPDMDGMKLIEKIRTELDLVDLPIVVHTARDLSEDETSILNKHAEAVILKGVESFDQVLSETALFLHREGQELPEEKRKQLEQQSETDLAGRKVLIIDDDIRNIFAITSLLERNDMQVIYEEGGEAGIERLEEEGDEIDAVLMDIMMPGMDGYEATRRIRNIPRFQSLPIIAVTAKAMKGDREKCIEAGASDYITKPVNVEQLTSLLRVWINK
jgi:CheY-like chemotaxis protein/signal transduction histidine kinase/HAMP domain-containing protein